VAGAPRHRLEEEAGKAKQTKQKKTREWNEQQKKATIDTHKNTSRATGRVKKLRSQVALKRNRGRWVRIPAKRGHFLSHSSTSKKTQPHERPSARRGGKTQERRKDTQREGGGRGKEASKQAGRGRRGRGSPPEACWLLKEARPGDAGSIVPKPTRVGHDQRPLLCNSADCTRQKRKAKTAKQDALLDRDQWPNDL